MKRSSMLIRIIVSLLVCLFFGYEALGSVLSLELGVTSTNFNYFQIPNERENRVNLEDKDVTSYRATYWRDLSEDSFLYFLYAPLSVDYSFRAGRGFEFDGENFQAGEATDVEYKFNSYRAGYFKSFRPGESFKWWLGFVLKIRDAKIEVRQSGQEQSFSNVGLVPLAGFGFSYRPLKRLGIFSHTDALAAPRGSAYDSLLKLNVYVAENHWIGVGKRILGGGVDNDTLKNFAQFDSYIVDYSLRF